MRKTVFLLLLAPLILCGCQSFSSLPSIPSLFKEPNVSLDSVDIAGVTLSGVNLIANVAVENLNSYPLPMPKVDWELFVTDASLAEGTVEEDRSIGSGEKLSLDIPISLGYDRLYRSAGSILGSLSSGSRELPYKIAMGLSFPIPLLENKVYKLDYSGLLPLSQLPGLGLLW